MDRAGKSSKDRLLEKARICLNETVGLGASQGGNEWKI